MKEKILQFLKTKLPGVQNNFLEGAASQLANTITDEAQIETVCNAGLIASLQYSSQFAQTEGDRRATAATQTAVQNYEQKFNLKDGKSIQPDPTHKGPVVDPSMPEWAKSLVESNKQLQEKINSYEKKGSSDVWGKAVRDKVSAKFKDSKIPVPEFAFRGLSLESEADIDKAVEQVSGEFEKYQQDLVNNKVIVDAPKSSGATPDAIKEEITDLSKKF